MAPQSPASLSLSLTPRAAHGNVASCQLHDTQPLPRQQHHLHLSPPTPRANHSCHPHHPHRQTQHHPFPLPHISPLHTAPQAGLIAGGLADGTVSVWDPAALLDPGHPDGQELAPLTSMPKHTSAVQGLDFNPLSSNLLASAGEDGQVCIWDLTSPDSPKLYPPMVRPL